MNSYYIINNETMKLEMHFEKADYLSLSDNEKSTIKSNFLFSRGAGAWVSRCKFPHLYRAEEIAKSLNLENAGATGERLTFTEQKAAEAAKAERRAERYDYKSDAATAEGNRLQAPIESMRGDIAFFTQPNINSSAGRAFTNKRNKMWAAWEKGFDSFKKSEYYAERAEAARQTAKTASGEVTIAFAQRRIDDAEKTIRVQRRNIESYEKRLQAIEAGKELKRYNGDVLTAEEVTRWIDNANIIIESNIEKSIYYHNIIESLGGYKFIKNDIKAGYIVKVRNYKNVEVVSLGSKNFTYRILTGGAAGLLGKAAYTEIDDIIEKKAPTILEHPFKVGEVFTVPAWNHSECKRENKTFTIVKVTDKSVILQNENGEKITRRPSLYQRFNGVKSWCLVINDYYGATIERPATV